MSDFVSQNMLPDLWDEILQRHWTFLETEESMQKLEERKKLEGCLKQFLCMVPNDRKFFLPETSYVLKKSIEEMNGFTAYNAMIGFESISQYANNLFTKPWRKEYRVIKMYSGFYQHEIKSKLLHAEKLFEAMGYRQFNQMLVLEGPICPDQVTNVSRDAMAAYVECQIMKQILSGLISLQIPCSWSEIFKFRETHICGQSQAIKSIAHLIHEKRFRKEKFNQENFYGSTKHQQQQQQQVHSIQPQTCCPNCTSALCRFQSQPPPHSQIPLQPINSCQLHNAQQPVIQKYSHQCSLHGKQQQQQQQPQQSSLHQAIYNSSFNYPNYPQMSHSKSLEHYNDSIANNMLPQRHSFDHYEPKYDCVDSSCNFNAYNQHPYNVSGNRYPLPYNISNQLIYGQGYQQQQQQPSTTNCNRGGHHSMMDPSSIYGYQQQCSALGTKSMKSIPHDLTCNLHTRDDYGSNHRRSGGTSMQNDALINLSNQIKDMNIDTDDTDGNYIYSKPKQIQTQTAKKITPDQLQKLHNDNSLSGGGGGKFIKNNSSPLPSSISSRSSKSGGNSGNKNQDGVGSFETWDFVFQNLEKHGYSKDLGERGDLIMQGLDLNPKKSNGINGTTNSSCNVEENKIHKQQHQQSQHQQPQPQQQQSLRKNRESLTTTTHNSKVKEKVDSKSQNNALMNGKVNSSNNRDSSSSTRPKTQKAKIVKSSINNNVENFIDNTTTTASKTTTTTASSNCKANVGEWSCRFCTFLNSDSKRICEMCCRSKDFHLDSTKNSATCV